MLLTSAEGTTWETSAATFEPAVLAGTALGHDITNDTGLTFSPATP
ncbi:hypothetical protein [Arthrobacter sp. H35-D1]|nr:hypothetical protein [Arthrobacter sp. H35-D1]MDJ0313510.1 hypothetical protein [Arthrobacter sp. H35-D1]